MYSIGLDFGTNSVRSLLLDLNYGKEIASAVFEYKSGEKGIITSKTNPYQARQNPADYLESMSESIINLIASAKKLGINSEEISGIGVAATASTPLPTDETLTPLGLIEKFQNNPNAFAWLWKDHTSTKEADEITNLAKKEKPYYIDNCGGSYSSEWFFSKIFHCLKADPEVFEAAFTWMELCDFIPAALCGIKDNKNLKRSVCGAGHKAMYQNPHGLPEKDFLEKLAPEMAVLRERLYTEVSLLDDVAGFLSDEWAKRLGLPVGIPVAVGGIDAHVGAIGSGIEDNLLIKNLGTSSCDILITSNKTITAIEGIAGVVPESVLPRFTGIEAGQAAVGDLFNWYVSKVLKRDVSSHQELTEQASKLKAGESGLLALDWNNGNRNILADQKLTGLILGQTTQTTDYEIYRALIEASAFGALSIINRLEESDNIKIDRVRNCGGIANKNPMVMQIYANILGRPMEVVDNSQTVALGAAIMGGFTALKNSGKNITIAELQKRSCRVNEKVYYPDLESAKIYAKLYNIYKLLHDSFGKENSEMYSVMKDLLEIKIKETSAD
ncbi:MAG: ribulokinase [Rhodothermaceae bacterium]